MQIYYTILTLFYLLSSIILLSVKLSNFNHKRYKISLGIIRTVIDKFARPTDSWDEAVGGEGFNAMAEGDFSNEGNGFCNNENSSS